MSVGYHIVTEGNLRLAFVTGAEAIPRVGETITLVESFDNPDKKTVTYLKVSAVKHTVEINERERSYTPCRGATFVPSVIVIMIGKTTNAT